LNGITDPIFLFQSLFVRSGKESLASGNARTVSWNFPGNAPKHASYPPFTITTLDQLFQLQRTHSPSRANKLT